MKKKHNFLDVLISEKEREIERQIRETNGSPLKHKPTKRKIKKKEAVSEDFDA